MIEAGQLAVYALKNDVEGALWMDKSEDLTVREFFRMYGSCMFTFPGWESQSPSIHEPRQHYIHIGVEEGAKFAAAIQCVAVLPTGIDTLRQNGFDHKIHAYREYFPMDFHAFPKLEEKMWQSGYDPEEIAAGNPWYQTPRCLFFDMQEEGGHTYVYLKADLNLEAFENFVFSTLPDKMFPEHLRFGDERVRYALGLVFDGWIDALKANGESAHHFSYWFDSEIRAQQQHEGEVWEPEEARAVPSDPIAQWIEYKVANRWDPEQFHLFTDEKDNPIPGVYWYEMRQKPDRPFQYTFFTLDEDGIVHIEHGNEQVFSQEMMDGMSDELRKTRYDQLDAVGEFYYVPCKYFLPFDDGSFPAAVYLKADSNEPDFYDRMDKILGFLHAL